MLAIGRAFMSNPRVLLMDEPSEGLAPQNARLVLEVADDIVILGRSRRALGRLDARAAGALMLLTFALAGPARSSADQWPAPQTREVWSPSRDYFVRVIPGKSIGETVGFRGAPTGPYATAELYRRASDRSYRLAWTVSLVNPMAPIDLFLTDRGYLVTLDNWHNMGYGKIVAFYSPEGKLIRGYALDELFSAAEIEKLPRSVSSIWWRKQLAYVRPDQQSLYVSVDDGGRELVFETETGAYQFCETRDGAHRCRSANDPRQWRGYVDPPPRP